MTCFFIDEQGREVDNVTIETNGRLLVNYIKSIQGAKILTFEECELSHWLFAILKPEVDELIVCNPVANKEYKKVKTDKLDARKLAKLLRGNFLTPVFHDGSKREQLRTLMSGYQDLVEEAVRVKNRYKSLFRKDGNRVKGESLYKDEGFLEDLKRPDSKFIGTELYHLLELMEKSRQGYIEEIRRSSRRFKEILYLKTVPGIGPIRSAQIVSQVIDPKRFASKYKYFSYCGLVRHPRESAGMNYGTTRIWGNRILKCVYKMAAHDVLRGHSSLRKHYDRLRTQGVSDQNASNAISRKIAAISLSVWRNSQKYDDKKWAEHEARQQQNQKLPLTIPGVSRYGQEDFRGLNRKFDGLQKDRSQKKLNLTHEKEKTKNQTVQKKLLNYSEELCRN
ncbi:MAG: transposase [Elusimicrobia bacterium]|nr:transposase [Elusimicrobiota bacterium]